MEKELEKLAKKFLERAEELSTYADKDRVDLALGFADLACDLVHTAIEYREATKATKKK